MNEHDECVKDECLMDDQYCYGPLETWNNFNPGMDN